MFTGLNKNETKRLAALALLREQDSSRDAALGEFACLASEIMGVNGCFVTIFDDEHQYIKYVKNNPAIPLKMPIVDSMCQHSVKSCNPIICHDTRLDDRFREHELSVNGHVIFYAAAPLQTKEGFVLGTLCVSHPTPLAPTRQQTENFLRIASLACLYLEAWYSLGRVDALTGLPNRQFLLKEMERIGLESAHRPATLILFDCIDMPKAYELSRYLGLTAVEKMLRGFGPLLRLRLKLPATTPLYAFAPGRYALLIDAQYAKALIKKAENLPDIEAQIRGDTDIRLKIFTGYVHFQPGLEDPKEILRQGISALHEAIRQQIAVLPFDREFDEKRNSDFKLLYDLSEAIKAPDQFYLVYQPKISLHSGYTVGCEALLRWQHPELGHISPAIIVALAEKTTLMNEITHWVIRSVITQLQRWRAAGISLCISINVTVSDFSCPGFADALEQQIHQAGLVAQDIRIECLETEKVLESKQALYELDRLKEKGFVILLDDFGAGYSNISYLRRIPIDIIKLDRSLISQLTTDPGSRIIARHVIMMLKDLHYVVLAEGVEDKETAMLLQSYGCDEAQGYFFSRPVPPEAIPAWLAGASPLNIAALQNAI